MKPALAIPLLACFAALSAAHAEDVRIAVGPNEVATVRIKVVYLGVELNPVDGPTRALYKMKEPGMLVTAISPGSPADGSLGQGDILLRADDSPIAIKGDLRNYLTGKNPGDKAVLTVLRGGVEKKIPVTLASPPSIHIYADAGIHPGAVNVDPQEMMRRLVESTNRAAGANREFFERAANDVALMNASGQGSHSTSARMFSTAEGTVSVLAVDGKNTVVVTGKDGRRLAAGPLDEKLFRTLPEWAKECLGDLAPAPAEEAPKADAAPKTAAPGA